MSASSASEKKSTFVEWLGAHKTGEVDLELSHRLRELLQAVQDTGKAGTLTLTIKVDRKGERQVLVREDIKVKTPEHDRSESIYFVDRKTLNLTRHDPGQDPLPFKRRVDPETGEIGGGR